MKMKRTITRGQVRNREVGCEGRLWETCELMNKNCIQGRLDAMSWHHTAKSLGLPREVNAVAARGSTVFLPGEASVGSVGRFKSTAKTVAFASAMPQALAAEESAEGIVVQSESVSSLHLLGVDEECGTRGRRPEPKKRKQPEVICE